MRFQNAAMRAAAVAPSDVPIVHTGSSFSGPPDIYSPLLVDFAIAVASVSAHESLRHLSGLDGTSSGAFEVVAVHLGGCGCGKGRNNATSTLNEPVCD